MSKLHASRPSAVRHAAIAVAVMTAALASPAAQAHLPAGDPAAQPASKASKANKSIPAATAAAPARAPARPAMQGVTIARDADTGVLRAPTPQEAAALVPAAPEVEEPLVEFDAGNGLIGVNVPASMLTYTVVSRSPDGALAQMCLPNEKSANDLVRKLAERAVQPAAPRAPAIVQARRAANEAQLRPAAGAPHE